MTQCANSETSKFFQFKGFSYPFAGGIAFKSKNLKESRNMVKLTVAGQPCRNCKTPVIKAIPKKRNPKRAYWFEWYLSCPKCGYMYMLEDAKIINPDFKKMEDPKWKKDWVRNKELKQELEFNFKRLFR